jgi:hypothetical protein
MHKTFSIEKQSRPSQVLLQLGELYKRHCKFDDWVTQDMTNPGFDWERNIKIICQKMLEKNMWQATYIVVDSLQQLVLCLMQNVSKGEHIS